MRIPIIAGNWKMYKDLEESKTLAESLKNCLKDVNPEETEVAICPTFTNLASVNEIIKGSNIKLGAQNMYPKQEGAFTGEISPLMLRSVGCHYVIIGHSERRQFFGETNSSVNEKVKVAFEYALVPIMCVGETLEQRENGTTNTIVKAQVVDGLKDIPKEKAKNIVIAYEPVWAIGTGKVATKEQAQEVHAMIRGELKSIYDEATANSIRIQYGGSVKPDNVKELMAQPDIDGALVGGAALKVDSFEAIVKFKK
ncbi:MAG: triose-phosphate isomerase [Candidatus Goldiibacteriota bacterium HGW-Goldbacteria-1]|nr:MAG: triose-phosphate isomerase [Candidatus Goldiibacteriota bacterium HGW-Goldbacteria-1]